MELRREYIQELSDELSLITLDRTQASVEVADSLAFLVMDRATCLSNAIRRELNLPRLVEQRYDEQLELFQW
jgi:hypothetical protein